MLAFELVLDSGLHVATQYGSDVELILIRGILSCGCCGTGMIVERIYISKMKSSLGILK